MASDDEKELAEPKKRKLSTDEGAKASTKEGMFDAIY